MNLLFFLTPKQDVLYIYEDFTLRQTLEKWSNQRYATIPVLKRNGEYVGSITEGDILWGMKNLHGLDLEASEDVPISSFPRRRDYKAVTVTTDMPTLLKAAIEQNFVRWWMTAMCSSAWCAVPCCCGSCTTNTRPCRRISASRAATRRCKGLQSAARYGIIRTTDREVAQDVSVLFFTVRCERLRRGWRLWPSRRMD